MTILGRPHQIYHEKHVHFAEPVAEPFDVFRRSKYQTATAPTTSALRTSTTQDMRSWCGLSFLKGLFKREPKPVWQELNAIRQDTHLQYYLTRLKNSSVLLKKLCLRSLNGTDNQLSRIISNFLRQNSYIQNPFAPEHEHSGHHSHQLRQEFPNVSGFKRDQLQDQLDEFTVHYRDTTTCLAQYLQVSDTVSQYRRDPNYRLSRPEDFGGKKECKGTQKTLRKKQRALNEIMKNPRSHVDVFEETLSRHCQFKESLLEIVDTLRLTPSELKLADMAIVVGDESVEKSVHLPNKTNRTLLNFEDMLVELDLQIKSLSDQPKLSGTTSAPNLHQE